MKLETFFGKFDLFADVPGAVAKIRELILESAIRGNLVSQDKRDNPASELIKQITRIQNGQSKKRPPLAPVGDDAYLMLPEGWEWIRLGNTGRIFNGNSVNESGKIELSKVEVGLPFIATKDVGYGRDPIDYDNGLKVSLNDSRFKIAHANAILICAEGGSAGRKVGIIDRDVCFGNKLYANEVWDGIQHRFIFYVYQSPTFFKEFSARMSGIIGGIARSEFLSLPIPLPPEEEQKRIVAKVDELMMFCDQLEIQQRIKEKQVESLARASLTRFAEAPTPANLEFLFHKTYDIPPSDLRKSIFTLAVQGKLVPQEPDDLPAIDLEKPDTELTNEPIFDIPQGWVWTRLGNIADINGGFAFKSTDYTENGMRVVRISDFDEFGFKDHKVVRHPFTPDLAKFSLSQNNILMAMTGGTVGKSYFVRSLPEPMIVNQRVATIKVSDHAIPNYIDIVLRSEMTQEVIRKAKNSTNDNISMGDIKGFAIPLPPSAEQRRIVSKVDELMALVGALESQLASAYNSSTFLLTATILGITTGKDTDANSEV